MEPDGPVQGKMRRIVLAKDFLDALPVDRGQGAGSLSSRPRLPLATNAIGGTSGQFSRSLQDLHRRSSPGITLPARRRPTRSRRGRATRVRGALSLWSPRHSCSTTASGLRSSRRSRSAESLPERHDNALSPRTRKGPSARRQIPARSIAAAADLPARATVTFLTSCRSADEPLLQGVRLRSIHIVPSRPARQSTCSDVNCSLKSRPDAVHTRQGRDLFVKVVRNLAALRRMRTTASREPSGSLARCSRQQVSRFVVNRGHRSSPCCPPEQRALSDPEAYRFRRPNGGFERLRSAPRAKRLGIPRSAEQSVDVTDTPRTALRSLLAPGVDACCAIRLRS